MTTPPGGAAPATVVVSTCGTSSLRNDASPAVLAALRSTASAAIDVVGPAADEVRAWAASRAAWIAGATESDARRASAEVNGLCALAEAGDGADIVAARHYVVASDSLQGAAACDVVVAWLRARGAIAERVVIPGLAATASEPLARAGVALSRWLVSHVEPARLAGGRVVFHLSGGLKAVGALMQVLAGRHADEVVFLFDGPAATLLRIPRIPTGHELVERCGAPEAASPGPAPDAWTEFTRLLVPERARDRR